MQTVTRPDFSQFTTESLQRWGYAALDGPLHPDAIEFRIGDRRRTQKLLAGTATNGAIGREYPTRRDRVILGCDVIFDTLEGAYLSNGSRLGIREERVQAILDLNQHLVAREGVDHAPLAGSAPAKTIQFEDWLYDAGGMLGLVTGLEDPEQLYYLSRAMVDALTDAGATYRLSQVSAQLEGDLSVTQLRGLAQGLYEQCLSERVL